MSDIDQFFTSFTAEQVFGIADILQKKIAPAQVRMFFVGNPIFKFAQDLVDAEMAELESWGHLHIPRDAIRHGQLTILCLPRSDGTFITIHLDEDENLPSGSEKTIVACGSANPRYGRSIGHFFPNGTLFTDRTFADEPNEGNIVSRIIAVSAFMLSLINQPTLVSNVPLVSRQVRRSLQRKGIDASRWSMVSWDVSRASAARHAKMTGGKEGVALHWRRGHWRRAEAHYHGAVQRPDALRVEERDLWWQWIEGMWVGHPAFGFVQSVHAPKINLNEVKK